MSLHRLSGIATSSGSVKDAQSGAGIPGVTIELLSLTGAPTGTYYTTDNNGAFVSPTFGAYGLRFTHAEYAPVDMAADTVAQDMQIYMLPKYTSLPGITITAGNKKWWWILGAAAAYYGYTKKWF